MLGKIFDPFVKKSPVAVMAGGILERVFASDKVDELFEQVAERQYTRDLLFSTIFELMIQVVCGSYKSVHAAYQASDEQIAVSITSVYNKLNAVEPETSATLVRYSAQATWQIIQDLGQELPSWLPGYRVKILDGNCHEATEHRIRELRQTAGGALPGKSLAVLDPALKTIIDVFPCEDGHAQERSLLGQVLSTVRPGDCWIGDRNFCTIQLMFTITDRNADFIVREHKNIRWEARGRMKSRGSVDGGKVSEQPVVVKDKEGRELELRRIRIRLDEPTRDGERDVFLLTRLPGKVRARRVADLYRKRWTIETAFQELAEYLNSEINTLGYPKAALFAFSIALIAYNVMSVVRGALRSVHGEEAIEQGISSYYIADEISGTYRGMMIAIPEKHWRIFRRAADQEFAKILKMLASNVTLRKYKKHPRGPKKPVPPRRHNKSRPHVSTSRLIAQR